MTAPKYELLPKDETGLHRIRALRDVRPGVIAGDLGGYIERESNLSQEGTAWVSGAARVFRDARVSGDAWVSGAAQVYGAARVYGAALVYGTARAKKPLHVYSISGPITPNADNATLMRLKGGKHMIRIGCWEGTAKGLRTLAASDRWPSGGDADYRDQWRQSLLDVADLFDRRRKMWRTA